MGLCSLEEGWGPGVGAYTGPSFPLQLHLESHHVSQSSSTATDGHPHMFQRRLNPSRGPRGQKASSWLVVGAQRWGWAYLAWVFHGEDPAPRAAVGVLQANELTDRVVGAPKAPCDQPLQLSQVQGAVGQVWEGVGVHPCNLQVWGAEDKVKGSKGPPTPVLSAPPQLWAMEAPPEL